MNGKPETTLKQQQQNGAVVVANGGGMVKEEEEEEEEETMTCGWRGWRPQWLQACNNPKVFLILLCWLVIVQGENYSNHFASWNFKWTYKYKHDSSIRAVLEKR